MVSKLNNKLAVQSVDISQLITIKNTKHTIQYAHAVKYGNIVTLVMRIATNNVYTAAEDVSVTLPPGYWPPIPFRIPCMLNNNPIGNPVFGYTGMGYCVIDTVGDVTIRDYTSSNSSIAIISATYIAS